MRRLRAIEKAFRTDIRHLLERETWVNRMLVYPEKDPQVKLVVVQGAQGIGKSHAQALLIRRLLGVREEDLQSAADHEALALLIERLERESDYYLVPYRFETGAEKRAEDYLDEYLATILSDLTSAKVSDETKQRPLEIRIDSLMAAIKSHEKKVILLLDGAECIFPQQAGQWSKSWAQFFEVFAREPHQATMYVMTRVWAGMEESQYIEQTDLPELSTSASIAIWQHSGFEDVTEDTLREVCIRCCGNNPQMMIMLIAQCKKRSFALARWETNGTLVQNGKKSANQERLEALLTQDTMFDLQTDAKSRLVLERALTSQISHQAKQMLECLACSPFGLPLSLLFEQFAHAEKAFFHELLGASAIDVGMLASRRAVLVPFIREAVLQSLISDGRLTGIQDRVTELYVYWLETVQDFRDDSEKSALIAEMIVRYIRQQQLLKAAELIINFGWLCALFGQINRVQRVFDEVVSTNRGKDTGNAYEAGRVLLSYHLMMTFGEKINLRERDKDFHMVRDLCLAGKIVLRPSVEISLAHYLTLKMIHEKRYQYACDFLDETFLRISAREEVMPEDRASYLHSKSHLLGQWSSYAVETNQPEEAKRLYGECVEILTEVIATYTIGLSHALPIQERHYQFKIAKAWNDLAYYSRMLGRLEDAERAIIECLELKDQKKANVPNSLAVSYGEYAKILAALGKYKDAETKSDKAVALLQPGSPSTPRNKGMLLVERAQICEIQGRMDEAYQLAQEALPLLSGDRNTYRFEANQLCARIQAIRESTVRYQLDSEWYRIFSGLRSLCTILCW